MNIGPKLIFEVLMIDFSQSIEIPIMPANHIEFEHVIETIETAQK